MKSPLRHWITERGGCQRVFHAINEQDLVRILRHPATMVGSDGEIPTFGVGHPHLRSYGTFARPHQYAEGCRIVYTGRRPLGEATGSR